MLAFDVSINQILSVVVATIAGTVTGFVMFNIVLKERYTEAVGKSSEELQPDPKYLLIATVFFFFGAFTISWILNNVFADLIGAVIVAVMLWVLVVWVLFTFVVFEKFYSVEAFYLRALASLVTILVTTLTINLVGGLNLVQ